MTLSEVRQLAISLPEVTEEPHFAYTSFRVRGKIFATAPPEGEYLHIFVSDREREAALAKEPDFLEPLRWGRQVRGLRVLLPGAKSEVVRTLLVQAWSGKAPKRLIENPTMNAEAKTRSSKVDAFLGRAEKWQEELARLRTILLDSPLTEELKWGKPCYTFQESNVVIILPLKECCALLFAKGALLKDAKGILVQPTENTQAARQMRFRNVREIAGMESVVKTFIHEAIEVEKAGLEVTYKETSEFTVPEELQDKLAQSPALKRAFDDLTPGRQRGYLLYFSAAKQSKTREARIEKCRAHILQGKGLHD